MLLALPAVAALGLYLWPFLASPERFDGEFQLPLEFVVVEAGDGRPIEGAQIRVVEPFRDGKDTVARSGRDGRAGMSHSFPVRGTRRSYRRSGSVSFYGCWLEVSAAGHRSSMTTLADFTGTRRDIDDSCPSAITVVLREGTDPASALGSMAGSYTRDDNPGLEDTFTILPDGRVTYRWIYQVGCNAPSPATNLGYAKWTGGSLVISFWKRDGQGEFKTNTEFVTEKFKTRIEFLPISWGQRTYLIPREDLLDFCNTINQWAEPRVQSQGVAYLRTDDWKKPGTGFPDLPPEWMPYLLKKPVSGKVLEVKEGGYGARVDLGSKNGIRTGMELCALGQSSRCQLKVVSVEPESCVVAPAGWFAEKLELGQTVASHRFFQLRRFFRSWSGSAPAAGAK
jgi:hypothetical protein